MDFVCSSFLRCWKRCLNQLGFRNYFGVHSSCTETLVCTVETDSFHAVFINTTSWRWRTSFRCCFSFVTLSALLCCLRLCYLDQFRSFRENVQMQCCCERELVLACFLVVFDACLNEQWMQLVMSYLLRLLWMYAFQLMFKTWIEISLISGECKEFLESALGSTLNLPKTNFLN